MKVLYSLIILTFLSHTIVAQTISDIDGNIYNTVTIGTQIWTTENLKTTNYSDGSPIIYEAIDSIWGGLTSAAFSTYNNDSTKTVEFGNLYNYYAVIDSRNLCPSGWHIPSDSEWTTLINYLGGDSVAGGKMKEIGLTHWQFSNTGADNSSGLTVIPAGYRYSNYGFNKGGFHGLNGNAAIWTSTSSSDSTSLAKYFYPGSASVGYLNQSNSYGMSVRCISDTRITNIIEVKIDNTKLNIYPNPSTGLFYVDIQNLKINQDYIINIYDLNGKIILKVINSNSIDLTNYPKQTFILELLSGTKIYHGKMMNK